MSRDDILNQWIGTYVLDGHELVKATTLEWGRWLESAIRDGSRVVGSTKVASEVPRDLWMGFGQEPGKVYDVWVSTVCLGVDHSYGDGPPQIFETMVFGGEHDGECWRAPTWDKAEEMHRAMCRRVFGPKLKIVFP